jgi:hypothetical protein
MIRRFPPSFPPGGVGDNRHEFSYDGHRSANADVIPGAAA